MNSTAKSKSGPPRLAVQWLEAPSFGPLLMCRRSAGHGSGPVAGRCSAAAPRRACMPGERGPWGRLRAFTLLELMLVIAIVGFIAALALPHVGGIGQANSMITAARQLQDDVALARQLAMVNRSTVYMVFLTPMFWTNSAFLNPPAPYEVPYGLQVSNLVMHQYSAYALVSLASVGDQPGQHHPQYVTDWRVLPSGVFFAPFEFTLTNTGPSEYVYTTNTLSGTITETLIQPWSTISVPFPSLYPPNTVMALPCIGFTPQGSLTTPYVNQFIALARGSIFYPTDTNGIPVFEAPDVVEVPPENDFKNPNLIQIDWMTARATLMQNQFQ